MIRLFKPKTVSENKLKTSLKAKLNRTSNTEVLRWADNIHTGLGMNIQELRKSLTQTTPDQALIYIEDMRTGAVSLLAAMEILGERLDPNWKTDL